MSIPMPDLDLTDARIERYHSTVARKSIPAFCNCWIRLADQTLVQLRFAEVRGLQDLGFTKGPLASLEEAAKSKFATDLPNPPVFAGNRPGRVFVVQGELDSRYVAQPRGEIVAAEVRRMDTPDPLPPLPALAAPIPWEQASGLLASMRVLGVWGHAAEEGPVIDIEVGSPRGNYMVRGTGVFRFADGGYPGERGVASVTIAERFPEGVTVTLQPGSKGGGGIALVLEAASVRVHKVQG